jgi:biotin transport system substrate-specific component
MKGSSFIRRLVYVAVGAALLAVCSWISIPMPIPFTMQTFAVCLIAALLGWRLGLEALVVYILLGAVGLPVFSGFRGGFGVLLGVTGGYIVGFLFTALVVGLAAERFGRKIPVLAVSMVLGVLLCYAFGTVWFVRVDAADKGPISFLAALSTCVFPYLLPDAAKIALAVFLTRRLRRAIWKDV